MAKSTKPAVTVDPPLPEEQVGEFESSLPDQPIDQPIDSLGEDDEEDEPSDGEATGQAAPTGAVAAGEEGEGNIGDVNSTEGQGDSSRAKGKGKAVEGESKGASGEPASGDQPWQAVWSAEQNGQLPFGVRTHEAETIAWYFWNTITSEVTWTNPLEPAPSTTASSSSEPAPFQPPLPKELPPPKPEDAPRPVYNAVPDIDPDLAYLLPPDQRGVGGSADAALQTAFFNSRSGKFATGDSAKFDHLDEYNRQKRFNDHYFDVDAWQKQKDEEHAKRKRDAELGVEHDSKITKKDMVSSLILIDEAIDILGSLQKEEGRAKMEETGLAERLIGVSSDAQANFLITVIARRDDEFRQNSSTSYMHEPSAKIMMKGVEWFCHLIKSRFA